MREIDLPQNPVTFEELQTFRVSETSRKNERGE
jgi:hypothetical protein